MFDEKRLLGVVKTYLDKARPGDFEHTMMVVKLTKEILKTEKGDPKILITAAYLHDIGYSGLYKRGQKLDKTNWHSKLEEHMKRGEQISTRILTDLEFPPKLIEKISWIVGVHDDWYNQNDHQVGILIDADNLSKLDATHIRRKYDDPKDIIGLWEREIPKRLKTKTGKSLYSEMMKKVKKEFGMK